MTGAPEPNTDAARLAGWDPADGPPPFEHAIPPGVDPELGHNGVAAPQPGDPDYTGGSV